MYHTSLLSDLGYSWDTLFVLATQPPDMSVETDSHGRLYLSSALRKKYGEKFHVVEYEDRIELIPIDDDPLQAVRDEIGDALEGRAREELQGEALQRAKAEAEDDVAQAKQTAEDTAE